MIEKIEEIEVGKIYGYSGLKGITRVKINNIRGENIYCESMGCGCSKGLRFTLSFHSFLVGWVKLWNIN